MTRGLPAVWSSLLSLPFVVVGGYLLAFQTQYPLTATQPTVPPTAGAALAVFGLFVAGFGVYVQFVAMPDRPTMRADEWVVADRNPAQRSALAKALAGVPFLAAGLFVLYATERPLVYPTVALGVGLSLLSTGLHQYWRNTLTTYLLTNRRMLEEYRFLSLVRTEIPLDKVRAVEERQSAWEALFGLGNVAVRAGASGDLSVTVRSVYDSAEFADTIRDRLDRVDETPTGEATVTDSESTDAPTGSSAEPDAADSPTEANAADTVPEAETTGSPAEATDTSRQRRTEPVADEDDVVVDVGGGGGELPSDPPTALTGVPGRERENPSETDADAEGNSSE
ncbi:PH domain-containing protein [Salinigranum sp.]|uniref:PH domain-containing protein n=1 Tax=Salinigranum sp. TaxID=1966351 RepID=UPI003564FCF7